MLKSLSKKSGCWVVEVIIHVGSSLMILVSLFFVTQPFYPPSIPDHT